jgi:hypothetical protein
MGQLTFRIVEIKTSEMSFLNLCTMFCVIFFARNVIINIALTSYKRQRYFCVVFCKGARAMWKLNRLKFIKNCDMFKWDFQKSACGAAKPLIASPSQTKKSWLYHWGSVSIRGA